MVQRPSGRHGKPLDLSSTGLVVVKNISGGRLLIETMIRL